MMAELITLSAGGELEVDVLPYGATVCSIRFAGQELTLKYPQPSQYLTDEFCLGSTPGRVANRITKGRFELNGQQYQLACNNGPNHLHGGEQGFHRQHWQVVKQSAEMTELYLRSEDGDQGYPGTLQVWLQIRVVEQQLELSYLAMSNQDTLVNLTNHCYFNLNHDAVNDSGSSIENHSLQISAEHYLPTDANAIPTAELRAVAGTAFDFTVAKTIGPALAQQDEQLQLAHGFDHCYVWPQSAADELKLMATLQSPQSGRQLQLWSTQPGLQLYTGNFLASPFAPRQGVCLEAQGWPDAVNQPGFPAVVLKAAQLYQHHIVYKFS